MLEDKNIQGWYPEHRCLPMSEPQIFAFSSDIRKGVIQKELPPLVCEVGVEFSWNSYFTRQRRNPVMEIQVKEMNLWRALQG